MGIVSQQANIIVYRGIDFFKNVRLTDEAGNPVNPDGGIPSGTIVTSYGLLPLLPSNLRLFNSEGVLQIMLESGYTATLPVGSYTYAVSIIEGGVTFPVISGSLTVREKALLLTEDTAWDDLRTPAKQTKLGGSKDPGFAKFLDNGAGSQGVFTYWFDPSAEEELYFDVQLPHNYLQGSTIYPHVHWSVLSNGTTGAFVKWGLEYSWANINGIFDNTTIITTDASTASEATQSGDESLITKKHYMSLMPGIVGTGKLISSMIECRVFRNATDPDDDYVADAGLLEFDFHYQVDGFGSQEQGTK